MDPATRVRLGRSALQVTRLGLGTAPLGGLFASVGDADASAVLARAYAEGLRLFDTAPLYGSGLAERRVGSALRERPRDEFVLATKVGRLLRAGAPPDRTQFRDGRPLYQGALPFNPVFDFSYDGVLRSMDESLERLGLGRIDILHIHDPDDHYDEARAGAYAALARLRGEGVIGAVGVGMNGTAVLLRFARETDVDCFLVAGRYTLLDQSALPDLLPVCLARGIAVIAGGVFNSGILAAPAPDAPFDYGPAAPEVIAKARRLEALCAEHGVPLAAAALQFPFGHPAVTAVVVGCRSEHELADNVRMFRRPIPASLWDGLRRARLLPDDVPVPPEAA
ncbi:MAG TPA: aldo/keto reductase [bacterium]|nr:aldo/keto reductase [bacterium]